MLTDMPDATAPSNPLAPVDANGVAYFFASVSGDDVLWRSDGTPGGTSAVFTFADANVSTTTLAAAGNRVFFRASTNAAGLELWTSDGTAAGTMMVRDINPGTSNSTPSSLVAIGNTVYFSATGSGGNELWKSDGTFAGTNIVKDLVPGSGASLPDDLVRVGNVIYFSARSSTGLNQLWKTDGTSNGTVLLRQFDSDSIFNAMSGVTASGGSVYFAANHGGAGTELWKSDGTAAGTVMVRDINPGSGSSLSSSTASMVDVNGTLFLVAFDPTNGTELWKTDGTAGGTTLVNDINPGTAAAFNFGTLTRVGPRVFFNANDGTGTAQQLWASDGTAAGTVKLSSQPAGTSIAFAGSLYFSGYDLAGGTELWRSDGTPAGTGRFADLDPGLGSSAPEAFAVVNNRLFFSGLDPLGGREPFVSDGTAAGTTLLKDLNTAPVASPPGSLTVFNDDLYFTRSGSLYKRDHVSGAVTRVTGLDSTGPTRSSSLAVFNGELYFTFGDRSFAPSLWKTADGTPGSLELVMNVPLPPPSNGGSISRLTVLGDRMYFSSVLSINQGNAQAFVTDGTAAGTVRLAGTGATPPLNPVQFAKAGDTVYFYTGSFNGLSVWATDGTSAGTRFLQTFVNNTTDLAAVNGGTIVFPARTDATNLELWRYTPGAAAPERVVDLDGTGAASVQFDTSNPDAALVEMNGFAYFFGNGAAGVGGLWRTDGTAAGTVRLSTVVGTTLTRVGDRLFFRSGSDVWTSDGTAAGTQLVKNVGTNTGSFGNLNGVAYFGGSDSSNGSELWRSDGTPAGTTQVADLNLGPNSSSPADWASGAGQLFFAADDGTHGREVWRAAPELPPAARVQRVFVAGSAWSTSFRNHLASRNAGEAAYGFAIDASDQLNELPWVNLDTVSIRFSDDVVVTADSLRAFGLNTATHALNPAAFSYDAATRTATWRFAAPLASPEKVRLVLGGVVGANGVAIDGDWRNPTGAGVSADSYPSGNGAPGGAFDFRLNVLPGDVNRSGGSVIGSDVTAVRNAQNFSPGSTGYSYFYDVNGSGSILGSDVTAVRNRQGFSLPAGEPGTAPATVAVTPATFTRAPAEALPPRKRLTDGIV